MSGVPPRWAEIARAGTSRALALRCDNPRCSRRHAAKARSLDDLRFDAEAWGWSSWPAERDRLDLCPDHS